jgi:glycosyltransferase involved in cell wall biosynthesis
LKKKVLFLLPYPLGKAPSQRFRVEAYFSLLDEHDVNYTTHEFLDEEGWSVLYKQGSVFRKVSSVLKGFLRRAKVVLFDASEYAYIFIHREAAPLGPPIFEWFLARVLMKKIIYDFDDAIWIPNTSRENKIAGWIKAFWKIKYICRWSYKVAGGNNYLCDYARSFNDQVVLLPTCVDTEKRYNQVKDQDSGKVVIGWTGSHSTMKYLDPIVPVLTQMAREFDAETVIISNKEPSFDFHGLRFFKWQESTEIEDLLKFNIGIMPLEEDAWSEGKCGFKLIQYLALGIPAVASAVGVNKNIIEHGHNGFLCFNDKEWIQALRRLIKDTNLRISMGQQGRKKIEREFSIHANEGVFLKLFM